MNKRIITFSVLFVLLLTIVSQAVEEVYKPRADGDDDVDRRQKKIGKFYSNVCNMLHKFV